MMILVSLIAAYLLGAIPMGYLVLRWLAGKDLTALGSGRTGGTNAMRAGGWQLGVLTSVLDIAKGYAAVWLASRLGPQVSWLPAAAGAFVVVGHNWSIWLYLKSGRLSGGAGTGPNVGAATYFWPPILPVLVLTVLVLLFGLGYASITSFVVGLMIPLILAIRVVRGAPGADWSQVAYGIATLVMVTMALLPNFKRLLDGTERLVGWRARR